MARIRNYGDWYRLGPWAAAPQSLRQLVPEENRSITAGPVHLINVLAPAAAVVEPAVPEYALHFMLRSAPLLQVGFNRPPRWLAVPPGSMLLAPPDTDCEYIGDVDAHVITVAIPKAHVAEFVEDSGARIEVRQEEVFSDPRLALGLVRLWHEAAADTPGSRLFADQMMRTLLQTFARRSGRPPSPQIARERLSGHVVRRLRDYIESRLGDELDVTTLAAVSGLSPAHFARAFTATVGMSPFRYVMMRRLAHAREQLVRTRRSVLDIALDAGFKTPSHFTARFRAEFGLTPRAVRPDRGRSFLALP